MKQSIRLRGSDSHNKYYCLSLCKRLVRKNESNVTFPIPMFSPGVWLIPFTLLIKLFMQRMIREHESASHFFTDCSFFSVLNPFPRISTYKVLFNILTQFSNQGPNRNASSVLEGNCAVRGFLASTITRTPLIFSQ